MDGGLPLGRVTGRGPVLLLCDRRCIVPSGNLVNTLTGHEADKTDSTGFVLSIFHRMAVVSHPAAMTVPFVSGTVPEVFCGVGLIGLKGVGQWLRPSAHLRCGL